MQFHEVKVCVLNVAIFPKFFLISKESYKLFLDSRGALSEVKHICDLTSEQLSNC